MALTPFTRGGVFGGDLFSDPFFGGGFGGGALSPFGGGGGFGGFGGFGADPFAGFGMSPFGGGLGGGFGGAMTPFGGGGLLGGPSTDLSLLPSTMPLRRIPLNIMEHDKSFEITADLPGVGKDEVDVTHTGDIMTVSLRHRERSESESRPTEEALTGTRWHRIERSTNFVSRSLRMPPNADMESIKANMDRGVLHIVVDKLPQEAGQGPQKRSITIGQGEGAAGGPEAGAAARQEGLETTHGAA